MRRQVLGMGPGHAGHRDLGEVVERDDPVVVGVVLGRAVRDLDQEAARALDQQRQGKVRRDQMRVDAEPQQAQAVVEIMLPDGLVPFLELLAAPDVVDQDVEPTLLGADALDQPADIVGDQMIDLDRDAAGRLPPRPAPPSPRWFRAGRIRIAGRAWCARSRRPSRRRRPARPRCRGRRRAWHLRPGRLFLQASSCSPNRLRGPYALEVIYK